MGQAEWGWAGDKTIGGQGGWVKPRPLLIKIVVVSVCIFGHRWKMGVNEEKVIGCIRENAVTEKAT